MASTGKNLLAWLGFASPTDADPMPEALRPPSRGSDRNVSTERAMSLSTVYRGIQIHATAVCQLSIRVERGGVTLPAAQTSALVQRPNLAESRSAFLEYTVVSLYTDGNAFWRTLRAGAGAARPGECVDILPLNPVEVTVNEDPRTGVKSYNYRGETLGPRDIKHLKLLRVPGQIRGLGPIQAARVEIVGALDARDYGSMWLSEANTPDGVLTSDQELAPGDVQAYRNVWYGRNPDGTENDSERALTERLRVLGSGLHYSPLMLKPADVQFLETQQFTTTQIARLLGNPASLLLAAVEGNSQTYSNVEQDWIAYARFSLMKPLKEIEEALTDLLPNGQTARFNIDALLRTDTKTRIETHAAAIAAGVYDEDEARAIEGLPPRTPAQIAAHAARPPRPIAAPTGATK